MQIRAAQYTEAINTLSQAGDSAIVLYNKGLAQVLAKQYDAAIATLNEASSKQPDAWTYYVTAIAAARAKNESTMVESLKKAISTDSSLRAKVLEDMEFNAFTNSETFKNAIR
jgi:tetratricopeptide (TPR) repeat protein